MDAESPRAHCIAAGRMFQAIGVIMLVGAGCVWALSGLILPPVNEPAERWSDYLGGPHRAIALFTLDVVATCVGGLGLFGAGVGLSGERRSAGRAAVFVTGCLCVVFVITAMGFAVTGGAWVGAVIAALLSLASGALLLIALHCAAILKRFPPPAHNEVTDEFLEDYRRKRDERRKKYDV